MVPTRRRWRLRLGLTSSKHPTEPTAPRCRSRNSTGSAISTRVGGYGELACSVIDEPNFGRDLLDQVKLVAVGRQHRQSSSSGGQQDQCIVEALFPLVRLKCLCPRQCPGDQPGIDPDLCIGVEYTIFRDAVEERGIMVTHRRPSMVIGIADANCDL